MNSLTINNIYGHGYDGYDLEILAQAGFQIRPQVSTFAGAQKLRFVDFISCPCLEFIEVTDHQTYLDFVPPGMTPYTPGINLGLSENSPKTIQDYQEEFAEWEPYLLHENYNGDPEERLPGWNYLNFKREVVPGTFIWITEPEKPFPATNPKTKQPNQVIATTGMIFDLDEGELDHLAALVGVPFKDGILNLSGVKVYSKGSSPLDEPLPKKEFPLSVIILEAKDLGYFSREASGLKETTFQGQPSFYLETPPQSWDILITS